MCGIIGIIKQNDANIANDIINGLNNLQHRGQDSTGIYTLYQDKFYSMKTMGLIGELMKQYNSEQNTTLKGNIGLGHVRYSTAGTIDLEQTQPLYINKPFGISMVHNGNLTNVLELTKKLKEKFIHINSNSDSELLMNIFAYELQCIISNKTTENLSKKSEIIFEVVEKTMAQCRGSYSVIFLINGFGLVAFRDPNGIRPLLIGSQKQNQKTNFIIASESIAIDKKYIIEDIENGSCVFIDTNHNKYEKLICEKDLTPCLFEYIYFARPDSIINNILVYEARKNMAVFLANKILQDYSYILENLDVIVSVPETSRYYALKIAQILNIPYEEGFIKNNYILRTFIMPNQESRKNNINLKLNMIKEVFNNKNVLIIDDSIVRGNTSMQLIQMAKDAGAKNVYFGSLSSPVINKNIYGIAIPSREELVAYNKNNTEIAKILGVDEVIYNDLEDVIESCRICNPEIKNFEISSFVK
jgi:amidophosphoribosyltransferase